MVIDFERAEVVRQLKHHMLDEYAKRRRNGLSSLSKAVASSPAEIRIAMAPKPDVGGPRRYLGAAHGSLLPTCVSPSR